MSAEQYYNDRNKSNNMTKLNLNILNDWIKIGTLLVVMEFLNGLGKKASFKSDVVGTGSGYIPDHYPMFNKDWWMALIFTLLGYATYHIVVKKFYNKNDSTVVNKTVNSILKIGTILFIARLLSTESITNSTWLNETLLQIIGFSIFSNVTTNYLPADMNPSYKNLIHGTLQFSIVSILVQLMTGGSLTNSVWTKEWFYKFAAFAAYELVVRHAVNKVAPSLAAEDNDVGFYPEDEEVPPNPPEEFYEQMNESKREKIHQKIEELVDEGEEEIEEIEEKYHDNKINKCSGHTQPSHFADDDDEGLTCDVIDDNALFDESPETWACVPPSTKHH